MFARKESVIPSVGIKIQTVLDIGTISNDNVHDTVIPEVPPWTLHHHKFNEIMDEQAYCTPIYTDGSKDNDRPRVGCGHNYYE